MRHKIYNRVFDGTMGDYYHKEIIKHILTNGYKDINPRPKYSDDTPAHTFSVNHIATQYNLRAKECPIITLRPIAWKSAIKEILWIYQMQSNKLEDLHNLGIHYWDQWDIGDGTIGNRYGHTIKKYDLMNKLLDGIKKDPYGRRHIIDMWQYDEFEEPGLNPCCFMTIWNVRNTESGEFLDMQMIQRSSDFLTSVSINELQYVALQLMVAKACGYEPGVFTHITTNAQIYDRHVDNAEMLLRRRPIQDITSNSLNVKPIYLKLNTDKTNFYDFTIDDFELVNYDRKKIEQVNPQLKFDLGI